MRKERALKQRRRERTEEHARTAALLAEATKKLEELRQERDHARATCKRVANSLAMAFNSEQFPVRLKPAMQAVILELHQEGVQ